MYYIRYYFKGSTEISRKHCVKSKIVLNKSFFLLLEGHKMVSLVWRCQGQGKINFNFLSGILHFSLHSCSFSQELFKILLV